MFVHKDHAVGGENGSITVGMFVFLCLASQKPSEREFFVPARMDLGVKLCHRPWYRRERYPDYGASS
jgi:hypothetical protein